MYSEREQRKTQLETMTRTVTGRARIVDAYQRIGVPRGSKLLVPPPVSQMIDAILDAQFPSAFQQRARNRDYGNVQMSRAQGGG